MITVYGLKNCDTCRKAMKWLQAEGIDARLHDFRADGLDAADLDRWIGAAGIDTLLNKRGTTWRKLPASETENADDAKARALMLEHPALIKRPVFYLGGRHGVVIGFKAAEQEKIRAALS
jgi:Spx/MgsR family transcriptional regulator